MRARYSATFTVLKDSHGNATEVFVLGLPLSLTGFVMIINRYFFITTFGLD